MSRILIIRQAGYPWDVRIDKFVRSFISKDHIVAVLANNVGASQEGDQYLGAKIVRTKRYYRPYPVSRGWFEATSDTIERFLPDVIIVRDLPLFLVSHFASRQKRIPLWFDMAEDYPATFLDMRVPLLERMTVRNYHLSRLYERWAFGRAKVITVVCPESRERLLKLGVDGRRVVVLENYPDMAFHPPESAVARKHGGFRLLYSGNVSPKRGLDTVVDAMVILERQGITITLLVAGRPCAEIDRLCEYANSCLTVSSLELVGQVPYNQLARVMASSDVGVVPHLSTVHTRTTMPNKIYDYMAVGLPVLVSDIPPLRRVVEESGAGLAFEPGNPESLAKCIYTLYCDHELRMSMGAKARESYVRQYNWSHEEDSLFNALALTHAV